MTAANVLRLLLGCVTLLASSCAPSIDEQSTRTRESASDIPVDPLYAGEDERSLPADRRDEEHVPDEAPPPMSEICEAYSHALQKIGRRSLGSAPLLRPVEEHLVQAAVMRVTEEEALEPPPRGASIAWHVFASATCESRRISGVAAVDVPLIDYGFDARAARVYLGFIHDLASDRYALSADPPSGDIPVIGRLIDRVVGFIPEKSGMPARISIRVQQVWHDERGDETIVIEVPTLPDMMIDAE